ncbi:MAG: fused MFS/spermidine synthase [Anaerolineales bacterium]
MRRNLLLLSVFAGGMTSLGVELSASRLLGNVFGTTNLVWANIIGLILVYLTAGYFLGGKWADRSPFESTYYRILIWAGFTSGLVPLVSRPVLRMAAQAVEKLDAAVMAGSFISVLVLFVIPVTLLGCISPFAIRLAIRDTAHAGSVSGRIYALSTLGSILGTFLPVLWLIPSIGTARTFLVFAFVLMLVALVGMAQAERRAAALHMVMPVVLLGLAWLSLRGPIKQAQGQIFEDESAYNYIQVIQAGDTRYLMLNEGQAVHSVYNPNQIETFGTWDYFLAAPYFNDPQSTPQRPQRVGIVGLAAGTIAKQYTAVFGDVPIDGWEIDPEIIQVGREYFGMTEGNLNAIAADGRWGLDHSKHKYSVIAVDAYRPPYIPWHLTTQQFFTIVADHLSDDGVLVINVGRTPTDRRLINAMVGTIGSVFPSVYVVDVPGTFNSIVYATLRPTQPENLRMNLARLGRSGAPAVLLDVLQKSVAGLQPTPVSNTVFTDDHAPVEQLVNSIVIRFILGEGMGSMQGALN